MNFRRWFALGAVVWAVLVAAGLVVATSVFADRMPDPIASHWGSSGVPDGSMSQSGFRVVVLVMWAVLVVVGFLAALRGGLRRRNGRAWLSGSLAGGAVFIFGLYGTTVWANSGIEHWQQARELNWQTFPVLGAALLAALVAGWLANRGPEERLDDSDADSGMRLRADERAVWVGSVSSPVLKVLAVCTLLIGLGFVGLGLVRWHGAVLVSAVVMVLTAAVLLTLSSMRVQVAEPGVRVAFGPLRRPVRRLALERIESAAVERRNPMEVGGWGYRVLPGKTAIMLRGGECLVLTLTSGRRFYISVDGADRGAELVNALVTEHSAMGDRNA